MGRSYAEAEREVRAADMVSPHAISVQSPARGHVPTVEAGQQRRAADAIIGQGGLAKPKAFPYCRSRSFHKNIDVWSLVCS